MAPHRPQALRPAFPGRRRGDRAPSSTAIDPQPGQALVEIGPGLGAMTGPLLERCERLTVIELDRDLAARLRRNAPARRDRVRCAEGRLRRAGATARPAAARGRQPALQHLHADPVSPARRGRARGRPALHAAEGSGRAHGRRARQQGLRPPERDAAVALRHRVAARRAARGLRAAAAGGLGRGAHAAAAAARRRWMRRCSANWSRWPSRSAASCCATRSAAGSRRAAARPRSTCSGAPKRCRWPNTWRWLAASPDAPNDNERPAGRRFASMPPRAQAAFSHMAVSNALLIIGMFMPKLALAALFAAGLAGLLGDALGRFRSPLP